MSLRDIEREHYNRGRGDVLSDLFNAADDADAEAVQRVAIDAGLLVTCECGYVNASFDGSCADCGKDVEA